MGVEVSYKLNIEVCDKDGKNKRIYYVKGNSFTANFIKALYSLMRSHLQGQVVNIVNTDGAERAYPYIYSTTSPVMNVDAGEGKTKYGVLYGTGTTPFDVNDYKLESLIPHGDGDNKLHYYPVNVFDLGVVENKVQFKIQRPAINNGSVAINISEIGVVAYEKEFSGTSTYFLIIRDVLDTPITVAPGQTITATYTIYTTF